MSTILLKILIITMFVSCTKDETRTDVEIFIDQVKKNEYKADSLPEFSPQAIPILLKQSNDFSIITEFPINPLSAYGPTRLTVGECLLWTIEHIRLHYGNYGKVSGFPSFVPELRDITDFNSINLNTSQLTEAFNLYNNWWNNNKDSAFESFRDINPLENSNYRWK